KDDKGQTVASVIIGNTKWDSKPTMYVRKAGESQSWLVDNRIDVSTELTPWVDPQLPAVARDRVKQATLTFPDGTKPLIPKKKKDDKNSTVAGVPAGEELGSFSAGAPVGDAISYNTFEDVAPASEIDFAGKKPSDTDKPGPSAEYLTFDGMKI